jgi:hypothetical protein
LTLREVCDLVYSHHVDIIERRTATQQIVAVTALAAGAKDVTIPDPDQARAEYDAYLVAEPSQVDQTQRRTLRALGVA